METASTRQLPHAPWDSTRDCKAARSQGEALGDLLLHSREVGVVVLRIVAITTTRRAVRVLVPEGLSRTVRR